MSPCFSFLRLVIVLFTFCYSLIGNGLIWAQDSTQVDKIKVVVQVANRATMEPMAATVQAKMASSGHVVAIAKGDAENGFILELPVGTVYMVEAKAEGYRISAKEIDLSRRPAEEEISINMLMGTSGGYVQPDDLEAPMTLLSSIYFEGTSVDLDSAGISELRRIYVLLRRNPSLKMVLLGHADIEGSIYRNVEISELRTRQIRAILISRGISPFRLRYFGYGNAQPSSGKAEERYLNNRVDFHIIF